MFNFIFANLILLCRNKTYCGYVEMTYGKMSVQRKDHDDSS